jgi:hypothetical protein
MSMQDKITNMAQFWGYNNANHCAQLMREMIAAGADDEAIYAALRREKTGPRSEIDPEIDPEDGTVEDWFTGMRYAIADMREKAGQHDLHQELLDSAQWKEKQALPTWPNGSLPVDSPLFTPAEKVARMLAWVNRQIRQNGFADMVGNMKGTLEFRALQGVLQRESRRDPEMVAAIADVVSLALEVYSRTGGVRLLSKQKKDAVEFRYFDLDVKEGYRESRALDLFQAILADWPADLDPYQALAA